MFACTHLGARERVGIEKALGMLRERLAQPPLVAGSAIEWSEMRHAGAREELGGFVRQYERVRAAVSTREENGRNGREEEGKRNGEEESGCSRIAAVRQEEEKRPIEALWRHMRRKMAGFILRVTGNLGDSSLCEGILPSEGEWRED